MEVSPPAAADRYTVPDADAFAGLLNRRELSGLLLEPMPSLQVRDRFLDSQTAALLSQGLVLRLRQHEGGWGKPGIVALLKPLDATAADVPEVRQRLDEPATDVVPELPSHGVLREALRRLVPDGSMRQLFQLRQYRSPRAVYDGDRLVGVLSCDVVAYELGAELLVENEVEFEAGSAVTDADRARLDAALRALGLEPEPFSKFERAAIRLGLGEEGVLLLLPSERARMEDIAEEGSDALQRRARALLLAAQGLPTRAVSRHAGLSPSRVRHWKHAFREQRMGVFDEDEAPAPPPAPPPEPAGRYAVTELFMRPPGDEVASGDGWVTPPEAVSPALAEVELENVRLENVELQDVELQDAEATGVSSPFQAEPVEPASDDAEARRGQGAVAEPHAEHSSGRGEPVSDPDEGMDDPFAWFEPEETGGTARESASSTDSPPPIEPPGERPRDPEEASSDEAAAVSEAADSEAADAPVWPGAALRGESLDSGPLDFGATESGSGEQEGEDDARHYHFEDTFLAAVEEIDSPQAAEPAPTAVLASPAETAPTTAPAPSGAAEGYAVEAPPERAQEAPAADVADDSGSTEAVDAHWPQFVALPFRPDALLLELQAGQIEQYGAVARAEIAAFRSGGGDATALAAALAPLRAVVQAMAAFAPPVPFARLSRALSAARRTLDRALDADAVAHRIEAATPPPDGALLLALVDRHRAYSEVQQACTDGPLLALERTIEEAGEALSRAADESRWAEEPTANRADAPAAPGPRCASHIAGSVLWRAFEGLRRLETADAYAHPELVREAGARLAGVVRLFATVSGGEAAALVEQLDELGRLVGAWRRRVALVAWVEALRGEGLPFAAVGGLAELGALADRDARQLATLVADVEAAWRGVTAEPFRMALGRVAAQP